MLRPFKGSSFASRWSTTVPSEDVSDWSSGVCEVTSTTWLTSPTWRAASIRVFCCTSTVIAGRAKCLYPCFSTSTRYCPGNRFTKVKSPSAPLDWVRFSEVPMLVNVTLASVTAAPDASVTAPEIEPYVDWAYADTNDPDARRLNERTIVQNLREFMPTP